MKWKQASVIEGGFAIPKRWVYLMYYEAFNLLFRIENALRVFVYIVLKNELRDKWADAQVLSDDEQGTIVSLAKKRMGQAQTFGYLGHTITSPIMHLNSGELTRLIVSDAYWKLFKPYFLGSRDIIKSKLDEIGSIRNSIAHFRPIRADDVDVIKQNSKHVLLGIEQFLNQALTQADVVPTNTADDWYTSLRTVSTDQCRFSFQQSTDDTYLYQNKAGIGILELVDQDPHTAYYLQNYGQILARYWQMLLIVAHVPLLTIHVPHR